VKRRQLLGALGGLGGLGGLSAAHLAAPARAAGAARQSVLVVGAGWAGLSAARALRRDAPELDITVLDRGTALRALPLSNPWLVGRTPERLPRLDLAALAQSQGWRFVAGEVQSIDRERRVVHTAQGRHAYDWLVLAAGAECDYSAWFGDDTRAATQARTVYPAGFVASELDALQRGLERFEGGDLVMTVPPPPYRCPPAPYERAVLIAWWIKTRGLRAKLTVLDAGAGLQRFNRLFADRYAAQIEHRPHSVLRVVDPFARKIVTDEGELRFDHAMLLPPMRAPALVAGAGLLGRDAQGQATRWAAVDPLQLRAPADARVYLAGDVLDKVSDLFGAYPKTAHVACHLGAAVAQQVAAASRGQAAPAAALPQSICHVWLDADPPEQMRLEAQYRQRGDGVITQSVRQHDNPQPRDEDLLWARALMASHLGAALP
jgi:NADPH-dependent 2,4-dienoyl-CoA reductase/sulfur reductase-like enzyme